MIERVVSLVPSVTESLLAWGVTPVACTRFCEQPALPHVGGTKNPDLAAIVALRPGLVVMCDEENRREDADALGAAGIAVHSCSPRTVDEVGPALAALAAAIGLHVDSAKPPSALPPLGLRAFVPIWRRPWMSLASDTYGSSLLASLGVTTVTSAGAADTDRYPEVDLDAVRSAGVDVVLAPSEPFPFGPRHIPELEVVAPVILVDGQDLFWWGVRTPAAVARLHAAVRSGRIEG